LANEGASRRCEGFAPNAVDGRLCDDFAANDGPDRSREVSAMPWVGRAPARFCCFFSDACALGPLFLICFNRKLSNLDSAALGVVWQIARENDR
jgi:hypothetical protein